MIPEGAAYQSRHDYDYSHTEHFPPRRGASKTPRVGDRFIPHPSNAQWSQPVMQPLDPIEPYVSKLVLLSHGHHYLTYHPVPKRPREEFGGL
jgi:hypothetical protein